MLEEEVTSKMDIINLALANLSRDPVQNLDGPNPDAFLIKVHWETALTSILREHPWGFAMRRKPLAALCESPVGFAYAYVYPEDCVQARRVLPVASESSWRGRSTHVFEVGRSVDGRHKAILTDLPGAALEYTSGLIPCEEFESQFINALAWRLAAELSLTMHSDPQAHQMAISMYAVLLQQAKALDMRESASPRISNGDFLGIHP